jgi:TRAP-type C4-dicarboxylate transport system substrate-binding protein
VDYIKRKMCGTFDDIAQKNGFMNFAWADQDFDKIYSLKYDFTRIEDFPRAKFITWYGPLEAKVLQTLGNAPIPVNAPESPSALRQGVADSFIAPAAWVIGAQLYSSVKYINPMNIRYSPAMIVVTWNRWMQVPEPYRKKYYVLRDDLIDRFCKNTREDNENCLKSMIAYGLKQAVMPQSSMEALEKMTRPLWDKLAGDLYPKEVLDQLLANLADFRAKNKK